MKFTAQKESTEILKQICSLFLLLSTHTGRPGSPITPHPTIEGAGIERRLRPKILLVSFRPAAPGHLENNLTPRHHWSPINPLPGPSPVLRSLWVTSHGAPEPGCGMKLGAQGVRGRGGGVPSIGSRLRGMCVNVFICEPCESVCVTAGLRCVSKCL